MRDVGIMQASATKSPTYTILDLAWVPEGASESDLPAGFSFSR